MKRSESKIIHTILAERELRYAQKFESLDKATSLALANAKEQTAAALAAAKEAVTKAEISNEKHFESVNEFRGQQKDMIATLVPRGEADVRFKSIEDRLAAIAANQNTGKGRWEGANWLWGVLIGVLGLVIAFISLRH